MEFAKLYNFEAPGTKAGIVQLLVTYIKSSDNVDCDEPDVIAIKTVDPVEEREWVVHLPYYFNKEDCRKYFEDFGADDAIFWRSFIRRQITTPVYLNKIKFFINEINDIAYMPAFLDGMRQEYELEELFDSDIGALEVEWKPDGCYWNAREISDTEIESRIEQFELRKDGEIIDSFKIDHAERRASAYLGQTLMLEIQKIAYAMEKEEEDALGSI